jgi:CBS domain-containing protein
LSVHRQHFLTVQGYRYEIIDQDEALQWRGTTRILCMIESLRRCRRCERRCDKPGSAADKKESLFLLNRNLELHYRDELRNARASVLRDAEAFLEVLFAVERLGSAVTGKSKALGEYESAITALAERSALAEAKSGGICFSRLYQIVRVGRNEALHQGVFARHLADHAVELAIVLEDALANGSDLVGDYMVRNVVVAEPWQPLRVVRHQMLAQSFSCLPVKLRGHWAVITDLSIARLLRAQRTKDDKARILTAPVESAVKEHGLQLDKPLAVRPDTSVANVLETQSGSIPVLVLNASGDLLGLVTPFDLL